MFKNFSVKLLLDILSHQNLIGSDNPAYQVLLKGTKMQYFVIISQYIFYILCLLAKLHIHIIHSKVTAESCCLRYLKKSSAKIFANTWCSPEILFSMFSKILWAVAKYMTEYSSGLPALTSWTPGSHPLPCPSDFSSSSGERFVSRIQSLYTR